MSEAVISRILLGDSPGIQRVRALIARVARSELPVLIQGATGTGKELVAQALHLASGRKGDFVPFNVCAISEPMFEDTLFGHVRGAFTGAIGESIGYLAEADRGTVFLDEIGGLPLLSQSKLLRAIETKQFRPLGARSDRRSDFRVVAATNVPIGNLVEAGEFRRDLARRLRAVTVQVPPLADRLGDIPLLVRFFICASSPTDTPAPVVETEAMALLQEQSWPDNVRELRQVIECALALAGDPARLTRATIASAIDLVSGDCPASSMREAHDREEVSRILEECDWRIGRAAARLGVHRTTLFRRMRRLGLAAERSKLDVAASAFSVDLAVRGAAVRPLDPVHSSLRTTSGHSGVDVPAV